MEQFYCMFDRDDSDLCCYEDDYNTVEEEMLEEGVFNMSCKFPDKFVEDILGADKVLRVVPKFTLQETDLCYDLVSNLHGAEIECVAYIDVPSRKTSYQLQNRFMDRIGPLVYKDVPIESVNFPSVGAEMLTHSVIECVGCYNSDIVLTSVSDINSICYGARRKIKGEDVIFFSLRDFSNRSYTFKWAEDGISFVCDGDYRASCVRCNDVLYLVEGMMPPDFFYSSLRWEELTDELLEGSDDLELFIDGCRYISPNVKTVVLNCHDGGSYSLDGENFCASKGLQGNVVFDVSVGFVALGETLSRPDHSVYVKLMIHNIIPKYNLCKYLLFRTNRRNADFISREIVFVTCNNRSELISVIKRKRIPWILRKNNSTGKTSYYSSVLLQLSGVSRVLKNGFQFSRFFFIGNRCFQSYVGFDSTSKFNWRISVIEKCFVDYILMECSKKFSDGVCCFFPDLKNNAKVRNTDRRYLVNLVKVDPTMKMMLCRINGVQTEKCKLLRPDVAGVIDTLTYYDAYALAVVNGKQFSPPLMNFGSEKKEKDSFESANYDVDVEIGKLRKNLRTIKICEDHFNVNEALDALSNNLRVLMTEVEAKESKKNEDELRESVAVFVREEEKDREKKVSANFKTLDYLESVD